MRNVFISSAFSFVFAFLLSSCSYNDIYEPWFDENKPLYEEEVSAKSASKSEPENKADDEVEPQDEDKLDDEELPIDEEQEEKEGGFWDWLFGSDEEEVPALENGENVYSPEAGISNSDDSSGLLSTENAKREYDTSASSRREAEVVRPLENPYKKADSSDTETIATEAEVVETETTEVIEDNAPILASLDSAFEENNTEEEFVEIPIAVLTNSPTPNAPNAKEEIKSVSKPILEVKEDNVSIVSASAPISASTSASTSASKPVPAYIPAEAKDTSATMPAAAALIRLSAPKEIPQNKRELALTEPVQHYEDLKLPKELLQRVEEAGDSDVSFFSSYIPYLKDSANLDSKDKCSIRRTAELCLEYNCTLRVVANASPSLNKDAKRMAEKRANAIKEQLYKNKISDDKIMVETVFGDTAGEFAEIFVEY